MDDQPESVDCVSLFYVVGTSPLLESKDHKIPSGTGREIIPGSSGCLQFNSESVLLLVLL